MLINENKKSSEEKILFEPMIFDMPEKNSTVYHDAMEFFDSPDSVPLEVLENMSTSDFELFKKMKKRNDELNSKYFPHEVKNTDVLNCSQVQIQLPEEHEAMKTCFQHNKLEQPIPQVEALPAQRIVSLPNHENQNIFSVKDVNDNNAQKSELNAYHATQELIRSEIIAVVNYKPYLYKNFYYKRLNSDEIQTEILEKCRKYISKTGRAHFLSDVERFIIHEPML